MAIKFACPSCKKVVVVSDDFAGKRGKCKHCKAAITVPGATTKAGSDTHQATDCEIADWLGIPNQDAGNPSPPPSKQASVSSVPHRAVVQPSTPFNSSTQDDKTRLTTFEESYSTAVVAFLGCASFFFLVAGAIFIRSWFSVDGLLSASRLYRSRYEAGFKSQFDKYKAAMAAATDSTNLSSSSGSGGPYRVVAIQHLANVDLEESLNSKPVIPAVAFPKQDAELALCQTLMPEDLSAEEPESANIVVWIEYWPLYETHNTQITRGRKRTYTSHTYATQVNVLWRIVDLKQKRLLKQDVIRYSTDSPADRSWDDHTNVKIQRQITASIIETLGYKVGSVVP